MDSKSSYGNIFKTTFLFGFVQVFKAIISIIKNKFAAILIGADGMGLLGIYNSTLLLIQIGASLGINQSAVRDIAEANGSNNHSRISKIVAVTNKIVLITGALGCLVSLSMSHWLSVWTLGSNKYTIAYSLLGIVVALNIINDGKQAILKGLRHLKALAYASIIGSSIGLFTSVPLYYFFGKGGIVPELIFSAIIALLVSQFYVNRISIDKTTLTFSELTSESKSMVRVGLAMMFVSFLQTVVILILNSFIRYYGSLSDVGYFSAGTTLLNSYFGVIITALMTDYYPRIASVNNDNDKLQAELNKQSQVSLVLCSPLFVIFMAFCPYFIKLLYTTEFLVAVDYVQYAIYWTLITICSNQIDMILIAKGNVKAFTSIAILIRGIQLLICLFLYSNYGLKGLGISYAILGIVHMSIMSYVVYQKYKISFNKLFFKLAVVVLILAISSTLVSFVQNGIVRHSLGVLLIILSICFSLLTSKRYLQIDFIKLLRSKINN